MLKWLLLFLVVFAIYKLLSVRVRPPEAAVKPKQESVVACVHCGVFVPQSEAMPDEMGRPFCCEDHRLKNSKD